MPVGEKVKHIFCFFAPKQSFVTIKNMTNLQMGSTLIFFYLIFL